MLAVTGVVLGLSGALIVIVSDNPQKTTARFPFTAECISLASTIVCDGLINASLVYFLRGKPTDYAPTRLALNRMAMYSINVGIATTGVGICIFALWINDPVQQTWTIPFYAAGPVYVISILVSLNMRRSLHTRMFESRQPVRTSISMQFRSFPIDDPPGDPAMNDVPTETIYLKDLPQQA